MPVRIVKRNSKSAPSSKKIQQNGFESRDLIVGKVEYVRDVTAVGLPHKRDIIIWLPPTYSLDTGKTYPVLYMHDGQNIMDPRTSYAGADWRVDEWADRLIAEAKMEEIIIVGINNTPDRLYEYSDCQTGMYYRNFLTRELKPFIDSRYRTKPEKENTAIMGSSMGGLCSLLTVWKHGDVFGKAGCLSSSFYFSNDKSFKMVLFAEDHPRVTFYIDSGEDGKKDAQKMFTLLSQKGYIIGEDIDYYYARGAQHTESAWANRLERPLTFLFPYKK
ncbi:MAG: alpha/beta hydrolase [Ignavibacteriales bacterium]|nr:alpha/beta hydrolase [Ignavibacteriales bacterium]